MKICKEYVTTVKNEKKSIKKKNLKNKMTSLIHLLRHYFSNITPSFSNVTAT